MNLALKYRPKAFNAVVGQKHVTFILSKMVEKDSVPSALLFSGPRGVGKTSTARVLASVINGEEDHTAVMEIDAASNGLVNDVRALKEDLQYFIEGTRVVIIDEAHSMSTEAFNALLKMLEEPPPSTVFVLVTTEPHKIPKTVQSRCIKFDFKRASVKDIYLQLVKISQKEGLENTLATNLLAKIAKQADGSFRDAVMLFDRCVTGEVYTVEQYEDLLGEVDYGPKLFAALSEGPGSALKALEEALFDHPDDEIEDKLVELFQDMLMLKSGADIWLDENEPGYAIRAKLAESNSTVDIVRGLKLIWDVRLRMNTGKSDNNLKLCFVMLSEVFTTKAAINKQPATPSKRLSLEDI